MLYNAVHHGEKTTKFVMRLKMSCFIGGCVLLAGSLQRGSTVLITSVHEVTRPSRPTKCAMWILEQMRYQPTNRQTDRQTNGQSQL